MHVGIIGGRAPSLIQAIDCRARQACQQRLILLDRQYRFVRGGKRIEQIAWRLRCGLHRIAGGSEIVEQRDHARRHIETDGIAGAARRARIVRHQDGDLAFAARQRAQSRQRGNAVRGHGDTVGLGAAMERGEGKAVLRRQRVLERDHAGEHAAVELRQHHVHGEIGGAEATRAVAPRRAPCGGADDLKHRHAGCVERRRLIQVAAGGKRRRGDDDGGIKPSQGVVQKCRRLWILQAGDDKRHGG